MTYTFMHVYIQKLFTVSHVVLLQKGSRVQMGHLESSYLKTNGININLVGKEYTVCEMLYSFGLHHVSLRHFKTL